MAERLLTETNHEISAEAIHQASLSINHGAAHAIAAAVIAGLALLWLVIAITCHLRQPKVVPED